MSSPDSIKCLPRTFRYMFHYYILIWNAKPRFISGQLLLEACFVFDSALSTDFIKFPLANVKHTRFVWGFV